MQGVLCRTLQGHAHWVNTLALSTDYVMRTGAYDPAKTYQSHSASSKLTLFTHRDVTGLPSVITNSQSSAETEREEKALARYEEVRVCPHLCYQTWHSLLSYRQAPRFRTLVLCQYFAGFSQHLARYRRLEYQRNTSTALALMKGRGGGAAIGEAQTLTIRADIVPVASNSRHSEMLK